MNTLQVKPHNFPFFPLPHVLQISAFQLHMSADEIGRKLTNTQVTGMNCRRLRSGVSFVAAFQILVSFYTR